MVKILPANVGEEKKNDAYPFIDIFLILPTDINVEHRMLIAEFVNLNQDIIINKKLGKSFQKICMMQLNM